MYKLGGMVLLPIALLGCATDAPYHQNNPIVHVRVVCSQAAQSSAELEHIIRNPNFMMLGNWTRTFSTLSGYQTAQQRILSAKTVLWTIRSRCPGS